jgi:hypothetical protein
MTFRPAIHRLGLTAATLAVLTSGCSDGATSNGACEQAHPECVDEDTVDVPAEPSS